MHRSLVRPATEACWMYALTTLARALANRASLRLALAFSPLNPIRLCACFMLVIICVCESGRSAVPVWGLGGRGAEKGRRTKRRL